MQRIANDSIVTIYFEFTWASSHATHVERYTARDVSFIRDILPLGVKSRMLGLGEGDGIELSMDLTEVPPFKPGKILDMPLDRFQGPSDLGRKIRPRIGRFYPKHSIDNVPGTRPDSDTPFRVGKSDKSGFKANLNHPMAGRPVQIKATVLSIQKTAENPGSMHRWPDLFFKGPGMQARLEESPTDFLGWDPFRRKEDSSDPEYYATIGTPDVAEKPASEGVNRIYTPLITDGLRILDLMAGRNSHLPQQVQPVAVTGLGLSRDEMKENPVLTKRVVHDLNKIPELPFEDGSFDMIICTEGIEYLTSPFEIFEEAGRVLKPSGKFAMAFTDHWLEDKVIGIWPELYPFERLGLISQYFVRSELFENIWTSSDRGGSETSVFGVWGTRKSD